jgi:hypothetical protein
MENYGIYARLNIDNSAIANNVTDLSTGATNLAATLPAGVNDWQAKDIANNNTSGYLVNPVANTSNTILLTSNTIISVATGNTAVCGAAASNLTNTIINFISHTNRMSGLVAINENTANLPHFDTMMNYGRSMMYLTHKTDNIQNNSPILAGFTSILCGNTLNDYANTLITYKNSIVALPSMPKATANSLADSINVVTSYISTRYNTDVNYFTLAKAVSDDADKVKRFSNMGTAEKYLVNNFIGTDKIKQRLNS